MEVRCAPGGGRPGGAAAARAACTGKARLKALGGQGKRGAHPEHVAHVRDLGGVEAEWLHG
jgi:hypothetical protein